MGLLKKLGSIVINFSIFFLIVTFSPGLPPKTTFPFEEFSIVKPKPLIGALEINNHLDNAEHILEGKLVGAEHLLPSGNSYYASLHNGNVVRIDGEHITFIAKFGKPCDYPTEEHICGRPLGLAHDTQGDNLIVIDTYYGLWEVNLKTSQKKQLVTPEQVIGVKDPRPAKMFNSVAVAKNGDIFFSSSSSEFGMHDGAYSFFVNPSGRLIHYERKTGKLSVVLDNLWFANGVALSPDEEFVVVAETHASRISKYYLKGEKKGQREMFVEGLPGVPDNVTPDEDGLWIGLVVSADPENPMIPQALARLPYVRKFILRLLHLIEMPFNFITNLYPNPYTKSIAYKIGSFPSLSFVFPARSTIVRTDWNGKIVGSLHGFDQSVVTISHVMELNDYLYIGSPYNNYIARVKVVNKDMIHPVKKEVKREAPEPVKQVPTTQAPTTQAPTTTTTTPKPTTTQPPTTTPPPTTTKAPAPTTQAPAKAPEVKPVEKKIPEPTIIVQKVQKEAAPTKKPEPVSEQHKPEPTKPTVQKTPESAGPHKKPAPIHEKISESPPPQPKEPLKVIKKDGPGNI